MKKAVTKLKKRAGLSKKVITLSMRDVRITQDLGNGFRRHIIRAETVNPNEFLQFELSAGSRKVVSCGWRISGNTGNFAIESFPIQINQWILTIYNTGSTARTITPYLITKL